MSTPLDELKLLITEAVEGTITPGQMTRLNHILASSKTARKFYFEFIDIHILTEHLCAEKLFFNEQAPLFGSEATKHDMLLQALALDEKQADTIDVVPTSKQLQAVTLPGVQYQKLPRRVSRTTLAFAVMSAAAMLLLVLFAQFGPQKRGYEVATITDSLNAQWAGQTALSSGTRIATSYSPLYLKQGIVQFLFDNNTEVVIESPAEFQIISDDQIKLSYGRIFAKVPKEAIGFTVFSQNSRIIDLGTEFGIYSDSAGGVELHVLKGKTLLLPENKTGAPGMEVTAGYAKKISLERTVSDIPCDKRVFIRAIDSGKNQIWRGEKFLDMTDMITGGNGENKNRGLGKIDVITGERTGLLYIPEGVKNPGFQAAQSNPFIDGVFIPDQGDGEIISSTGLRFEQCPDTSGTAFYHISTLHEIPSIGSNLTHSLALSKHSGAYPATLLMHPNVGITFDLAAIRNRHPGFQITGFTVMYGFPVSLYEKRSLAAEGDSVLSPEASNADFYILIDGQLRTHTPFRIPMMPQTAQIPISDRDRFLTLVSTDSNNNSNFDWLVLENPKLVLEEENKPTALSPLGN
jgi:hypothetical protein